MKKTKVCSMVAIMTLFSLLSFSCGSTDVVEPAKADSYEDVATEENAVDTDKAAKKETSKKKDKENKNDSNPYLDFFTFGNKNEIFSFDSASFFTPKVFGGLHQQPATILVHLTNKTAGFGSKYQAAYYILQFDDKGRKFLNDAVNNYLEDFANKRLLRNKHQTSKIYGATNVTLHWGTMSSSTPNNGSGKLYVGYEFRDGSPYLIFTINPVHNNHYDVVGNSAVSESLPLKYYFNKELAKDLIEKLSDENVSRYFNDLMGSNMIYSPADEY